MKRTIQGIIAMVIAVVMVSCGDEPKGKKAKTTYLPEVCQKVVAQTEPVLNSVMKEEGFTLDPDNEEDELCYLKAFDGKDIANGSYMIDAWFEGNTTNTILAYQTVLDRKEVSKTINAWSEYINSLHATPSLWTGVIIENGKETFYAEGAMIDSFKSILEIAKRTGQFDEEEFADLLAIFGKGKADYQSDLKNVDLSQSETGCSELVVTITSMTTGKGKANGYAYGEANEMERDEEMKKVYDEIGYLVADGYLEEFTGMFDMGDILEILEEFELR